MTMGLAVAPKNGKFVAEFRFYNKESVVVAESSGSTDTRVEADILAQTWSKKYNAKIEA